VLDLLHKVSLLGEQGVEVSVARRSATASSTFSLTVFVSSSDGSCSKRPTEYPGDSCASPFDG
jgi:hypothetical protein